MTFGEALKTLRFEHDLTLRELAELTGISNPMLSQYETGQAIPSFTNAAKLSVYLNFSLDYLAGFVCRPKRRRRLAHEIKYDEEPIVSTKVSGRYCLKRDEDSHWFLVPIERETEFETICSEAYRTDDFEHFNDWFEEFLINGPQDLSFSDPRDSAGEKLP